MCLDSFNNKATNNVNNTRSETVGQLSMSGEAGEGEEEVDIVVVVVYCYYLASRLPNLPVKGVGVARILLLFLLIVRMINGIYNIT